MEKNDISIIIPVFHTGAIIESSISKIRKVFGFGIEIIVVVNEPEKKNLAIVKEIAGADKNIHCLYFEKKLGKGKAILEGFKISTGDIVGFIDADVPFPLKSVQENFKSFYFNECDCLIFSKWRQRSFFQVNQRVIRKCLSRLFNLVVRVLFKLKFRDTQGGAKFLKKTALEKIGYDFYCMGFIFDVELLIKLISKNMVIKEIPIDNYCSQMSTVNILADFIPVLVSLWGLKHKINKFQK